MKKVSELNYKELYDLVVTNGGLVHGNEKPRRIELEGSLDEIDPKLSKNLEIDTYESIK